MTAQEQTKELSITSQGDDLVWRASEIDKATNCMRQLGYSRLGYKLPPGPTVPLVKQFSWAMIAGLAMDDTLSEHSRQTMVGASPSEEFTASMYAGHLRRNVDQLSQEGTIVGDDTFDNVMTEGLGILRLYHNELAPVIHPVAVQAYGETSINGTKLVGHIDLIRKAGDTQIISDWKFTTKTANQMPASQYLRGHAYDIMLGDGSGQIELILLRRGLKKPKIETTSHFVTKGEHEAVKLQVTTISEMYRKRFFPMASPTSWVCSPKFCGFWDVCRGSKTGPAAIPGEQEGVV